MTSKFTPEAEAAWQAIPDWAKERLLNNVWCTHCHGMRIIVDFGGSVVGGDLILHGHCARCHGEVARVVEGG